MNELCHECGKWVPEEHIASEYDGINICQDCWGPPSDDSETADEGGEDQLPVYDPFAHQREEGGE